MIMKQGILFVIFIFCFPLNFKEIDSSFAPITQNTENKCENLSNSSAIIPINSTLLILNQTNFQVKYRLFPENCIFVFVITEIQIEVAETSSICVTEDNANFTDYEFTVKFNNLKRTIRLDGEQVRDVTVESNRKILVKIHPLLADEIYVS